MGASAPELPWSFAGLSRPTTMATLATGPPTRPAPVARARTSHFLEVLLCPRTEFSVLRKLQGHRVICPLQIARRIGRWG